MINERLTDAEIQRLYNHGKQHIVEGTQLGPAYMALVQIMDQLKEMEAKVHSAWCAGAFDSHPAHRPWANGVVAKRMEEKKREMLGLAG